VRYSFSGFLSPIANLPAINNAIAGNAIPVRFSLSGNKGLDILLTIMSPTSVEIDCASGAVTGLEVEGTPKGRSGLNYDSKEDHYIYAWGTDKAWAGTCRELNVKLIDGNQYKARFNFR
jgi:hypothetical protein